MTTQAARVIADALDQLEPSARHIFAVRTLLLRRNEHDQPSATYGPLTLEDFGRVYGIARERVRRLQRHTEQTVRRQFDDDLAIRKLAAALPNRLGERFPLSAWGDVSELVALAPPESRMSDDAREEIRRAEVWYAGFNLTVKDPDGAWLDITRTPPGMAVTDNAGSGASVLRGATGKEETGKGSGWTVWQSYGSRQGEEDDPSMLPRFVAKRALRRALIPQTPDSEKRQPTQAFWLATSGLSRNPENSLSRLRAAMAAEPWLGQAIALAEHPCAVALGIAPIPHGEGTFEWPASLEPDPLTVKRPNVEGEVWALRAGDAPDAD